MVENSIESGSVVLDLGAGAGYKFLYDLKSIVSGQSVVVVMDVNKSRFRSGYELWTDYAGKRTGLYPIEFAKKVGEFDDG